MDALRTGISLLAGTEPPELLARAPTVAANALRALREQAVLEPNSGLGFAASFLWMIHGRRPDSQTAGVFDRVLTCYSEYEMAASTFAARVTASTGADLYGAVVAAAAALKGPLHGGANEAAARMFAEIAARGGPSIAEAYVVERLARHERIMGFGHRVYMHRPDPRAILMQADLEALAERDPEARPHVESYRIVVDVMAREKDLHPNADLPIGLLLSLLNVPIELFTPVFLCARIAGLSAHVIEQHKDNRLYRPRVLYEGANDLSPPPGFEPSIC